MLEKGQGEEFTPHVDREIDQSGDLTQITCETPCDLPCLIKTLTLQDSLFSVVFDMVSMELASDSGRLCSSGRASFRSQRRTLRCGAQTNSSSYSGKEISKPLIGSHFLHIDDYSKEVSSHAVGYLNYRPQ